MDTGNKLESMSEENIEETAPASEQEITQEEIEEISEEQDGDNKPRLDRNGKIAVGVVAAIVIIFGGIYAYNKFVVEPAEVAAYEEIWWPENMLHFKEDYVAAINGDSLGFYDGFEDVVNSIDGTQAGLIAQFDLGIAYLNNGDYELARETLAGVDFGDEMVTAVATGAIGDSYMQEEDASNAITFYEQAIDYSPNSFTCPIYLKKCAFAHEVLGQWNEALAHYERIKKDFPNSEQASDIDKYIVFAKSKA